MIRSTLKSLLKPEAYPEPVTAVELVQTHASYIFLTDTHAYKVKKPVNFGFLNFSTIDRRRFYCNEEVRLNRRLCPDIYEGVVELRETANGAAFCAQGTIIDYAVKMKRLPADGMLDRMVDRGLASPGLMRRVASTIARFHRDAPTSPAIAEHGSPERIMFNWQENFDQAVSFEGSTLPAAEREAIMHRIEQFVCNNGDLFRNRLKDGFVRECDGDIHLDNICIDNDTIYIFDCIEFNDRFRCCDTAADIAFLLMDLDYHGRPDLAREALEEYRTASGDAGFEDLIDFYKSYRAFVRGKVESFRLNDPGIDSGERMEARQRATRYFRLSRGYLERRNLSLTLFITCGLMGTGKSTLAGQLAFELGLDCRSSDTTRKQLAGLTPDTRCRDDFEQGIYSPHVTGETYGALLRWAEDQLLNGTSVLIDAGFIRTDQRRLCADLAARCSARLCIIHLACSEEETLRRLKDRESAAGAVSDGRSELLADQRARFEPPSASEGTVITITAPLPPEEMCTEIYRRLSSC